MDDSLTLDTLTFSNPKTKLLYKLQFLDKLLRLTTVDNNEKKTKEINYDDIIGVKVNTGESPQDGGVADSECLHSIDIYAYPYSKPLIGSKCVRKRLCTSLCITDCDRSKSSQGLRKLEEVLKFHINHSRRSDYDMACEHTRFTKPLLVLLNPASGKSLGKKLFDERVRPMFNEAGVEYKLIVTERRGHGEEIARTADLSEFYGIVIVSGDGLLYEVYQGLMSRTDADEAVQTPIGILPAGSGNALCCSINYDASEQFLRDMVLHSTYVLLKHTVRPMDLVALDTAEGRVYSFLSVTWGIVADIDIESERFRNLGNARFTLEALFKIAKPRTYRGRLSFLPAKPYLCKGRSKTEIAVIDREPESKTASTSSRTRSASMPISSSKQLTSSNGITHAQPLDDTNSLSAETDKESMASESIDSSGTQNNTDTAAADTAADTAAADTAAVTEVSSDEMPALDQSVPADWVKIEDDFVTVIAAYQSHIGPESMPAPSATFSDGMIYLLIARAPVTRFQMLNLMGQMETGAHITSNVVELVAVKAFRLEPQATNGNLAVDGEKITYGAVQGRVLPGIARVMAM